MKLLPVVIGEFVDSHQPGWVRATFLDANGKLWSIVEKAPVITEQYLDENSEYSQPSAIQCQVTGSYTQNGRKIAVIDLSKPWGIAAEDGTEVFHVFEDQLIDK